MPGTVVTILTDGVDVCCGWTGKRESNGWPYGVMTWHMMMREIWNQWHKRINKLQKKKQFTVIKRQRKALQLQKEWFPLPNCAHYPTPITYLPPLQTLDFESSPFSSQSTCEAGVQSPSPVCG